MLTDYHLHLRPDDDDTPPERGAFTRENVDRYLAAAADAGIEEVGCSEHVYRFREALSVWRHPFWEEQARDDLEAYCEFVASTPLRLGLEVDFVPGAEDRTGNLLDGHRFDYVIGSVHFLGDLAVDHEGAERTSDLGRAIGALVVDDDHLRDSGRARERAESRTFRLERLACLLVRAPEFFDRVARPEFRVALFRPAQLDARA